MRHWLTANGGPLAFVVLGLTIGGFTNRPVGFGPIAVGAAWWIGGGLFARHRTREPNRKARERQARQIIAAATVTYRGTDWGDPLFTVELPTLNASVDTYAFTEEEAREAVISQVVRMLLERERRR